MRLPLLQYKRELSCQTDSSNHPPCSQTSKKLNWWKENLWYLWTFHFSSLRNLAIGIGIQNFPEGLAVSLPLRGAGVSVWTAFWWGKTVVSSWNCPKIEHHFPDTTAILNLHQVWPAEWHGGAPRWVAGSLRRCLGRTSSAVCAGICRWCNGVCGGGWHHPGGSSQVSNKSISDWQRSGAVVLTGLVWVLIHPRAETQERPKFILFYFL